MRIVVALGGNALLRRGEPLDPERQRAAAAVAARSLAPLAAAHELVVTHGNGPQVGLLALQAAALDPGAPVGLDLLGAESEGMIGYLLEQELANALAGRGSESGDARVATLLTRTVVDRDDPAFARPTKPIGPVYDAGTAARLAAARGWVIAPDPTGAGRHRRVVASPEPRRIVALPAIRELLGAGFVVVCAGGGGIPVTERRDTRGAVVHEGVDAVVDKDLASALLARELGADVLLLLTDQPGVYDRFGAPGAAVLARVTPAALRSRALDPGSMGPKAEAAARFAETAGNWAGIGALGDAVALVDGRAGTVVTADRRPRGPDPGRGPGSRAGSP